MTNIKRLLSGFFSNLKLEYKILLSTACTEILFVLLFLFAGMAVVTSQYNKLLYRSTLASSALIAAEFDSRLQEIEDMSNVVRADDTVQSILDEISNPTQRYAANYYSSLYSTLQKHYLQYKHDYIRYSAISCPRFVSYTYGYLNEHPSDEMLAYLVEMAQKADGSAVWLTDSASENTLFLVREIKKIEYLSLKNLGTFIVQVDFDRLVADVSANTQDFAGTQWILYEDDSPIYASKELSADNISTITSQTSNYGILTLNAQRYFFTKGSMDINGWDYIQLISYEAVSGAQETILFWYLLFLLLGLLLSFFLMHFIIRKTTRHIDLLVFRMKQFGDNSSHPLPADYDYSARNDEIGLLHKQFDSMAVQIQTLIRENYTQELLTREAQLKSLESQMNPHFLYNTLEAVNWRAKAIGEKQISQMVEALGHFLRGTLNRRDECFSLAKELALIDNYMTIQQLRFENRLKYSIDVPMSCQDARIPKLSLQPLFENAVHYALEQITEDCYITLTCLLADNELHIYVKNSGSEFPEQLLEKLKSHEIKESGLGIALLNIEERVQLMFGSQYGLSFYNEGDYAVVKLKIPYKPITQ